MKTLILPHTQLQVSQLCLGTNQFGTGSSSEKAAGILGAFFELGGNFIDTAHAYSDWVADAPRAASERLLGQLLKGKPRTSFVIATKGCEFDYRGAASEYRVTPTLLEKDLHESLEALQVEYVDLYWLHRDDPSLPVQKIIDALIEHQRAGIIKYFGCSNWSVERIVEAQKYAATLQHPGFVACQPMGGLARPDPVKVQKYYGSKHYASGYQVLHALGLTMIPYSSQSMGFFSKLIQNGPHSIGGMAQELYVTPENLRVAEAVVALTQRRGVSVSEIVLSYLTSQPLCTIPIIGASSVEQLRESIKACDLHLTSVERETLEPRAGSLTRPTA